MSDSKSPEHVQLILGRPSMSSSGSPEHVRLILSCPSISSSKLPGNHKRGRRFEGLCRHPRVYGTGALAPDATVQQRGGHIVGWPRATVAFPRTGIPE